MHPTLNLQRGVGRGPLGAQRGARRALYMLQALTAMAALACTTSAFADAYVNVFAGAGNLQATGPFTASQQTTANTAFLAGDAFASANLNTGTLRASITATSFQIYINGGVANATSVLTDDLYFHGLGSTVTVSFFMHVDGTFAAAGGASAGWTTADGAMTLEGYGDPTGGQLTLSRVFGPGTDTLTGSVTGSAGSFLNKTLNSVDSMMVVTATVPTEIRIPFRSQIQLANRGLPAGMTMAADFAHTAQITAVVPAGYSFTSASGHFLTTPVPEPTSAVLMLAGCAALAWRRRATQGWA